MFKRVTKVQPYGATSLKTITDTSVDYTCHVLSGDTMVFQFPEGIIDLSTLQFIFTYTRVGRSANDTLPKDTECLIDELEVKLGDTVVNKISNYQQLFWMLSSYAMDADWYLGTNAYTRTWTNRRVPTTAVISGNTFGMDTFLGFLGCKQVIDTRKTGKLTVRIRVTDRFAINTNVSANNWGFTNPFFRVHYLPESSATLASAKITFDDFTSIRQSHPGYDSRTTLIVDGRKKLDYVLARQVTTANVDLRNNAFDTGVGLTQRFVSTQSNMATWDFLVNGQPLHSYEPLAEEGPISMRELFPKGCVNLNLASAPSNDNCFFKVWAAGMRLDLPQREDGQQWEVSFETTAAVTGNFQYTFLYAKTTSIVDATSGKLELMM